MLRTHFSDAHRRAIDDAADPIHRACDFFVFSSENPSLDLESVNDRLHGDQVWAPWPEFLVAFASYGCGDYFALDTRRSPPSVVYIGPGGTPGEFLRDSDTLRYESFEAWYEAEIVHITCSRCGSRETRRLPSLDRQWLLRACSACGSSERTDPIGDDLRDENRG